MDAINRFVENNSVAVILVAVFLLFIGITISTRLSSKWGYLVMGLALVAGFLGIRALGIFQL